MSEALRDTFRADHVVLSVMGPHAGESERTIFARKQSDILAVGRTFWVYRSHSARPDHVQSFVPTTVLFIEPATRTGARPTVKSDCANMFSSDGKHWSLLPDGLGPVTGKMGAYAFVFSALTVAINEVRYVDLWQYETPDGNPIRFRLGASTVLVQRSVASRGAKSRYRRVLAAGTLTDTGAVWVR